MPAPQVLTAALETAINKALAWSSNGNDLLAPLADKACIIYIQELKTALIFRFSTTELSVGADTDNLYAVSPDEVEHNGTQLNSNALNDNECWISISIFAIDKLKQNNQLTKLIKAGKLDFSGDLGILQSLSRLFGKIDIDFEEVLSSYIGDAAAYQLNTSGKKAFVSMQSHFSSLSQTFADAMLDEKPIGVRPIMVVNFSDEVNQIRADVERFEARLSALEEKVTDSKGKSS